MKSILLTTFFASLGFLSSQQAFAACGIDGKSIQDFRRETNSFVQDMTIAKSRGDLKYMTDTYSAFKLKIDQCQPEEYRAICGFDCHIQLGEYNQFMASEVAYYYASTGVDSMNVPSPGQLQSYIEDGILILEKAKEILATQSGTADLNDYAGKKARYNLLLAQLYMAAGDNWYQSLSEVRLQRLRYIVDDSISRPGDDLSNDGSEQSLAKANYEQANWIIQSAALEVPEDNRFASIRAQIVTFNHDLSRRLRSLSEGKIFLDIDPEEFKRIPVPELKLELENLTRRIEGVEAQVIAMMKEWQNAKLGNNVDRINENRRKNEISMAQSSYRIAKLEGNAQEFSTEIETKLNDIADQRQDFEYEREKFQYQFGLKMKLQELRDRQALLLSRKESDILNFDVQTKERRLNELRFLMNWEMSKTNIEIQLSQFETQLAQLSADLRRKENTLAQVNGKIEAAKNQIAINKANISISNNRIEALSREKDAINLQQKMGLEAQLCNVLNQIAFLDPARVPSNYVFTTTTCNIPNYSTSRVDYFNQMCGSNGLRQQLAVQNIRTVEDTLCVVGGYDQLPPEIANDENVQLDCSGKTQIDFAKEIFDKEMELAEQQIQNLQSQRQSVKDYIKLVKSLFTGVSVTKATLEGVVVASEIVALTMSKIPEQEICVCGLASGVTTKIVPDKTALIVLEKVRQALEIGLSWAQYVAQNKQQIDELKQKVDALDHAISEVEFQKNVKSTYALRAVAEIQGRSTDLSNELLNYLILQETTIVECQGEDATIENNLASALSEYNRLLTSLASLDLQNDNLQLSIDNERLQQQQQRKAIDNIELDKEGFELEVDSLTNEIATVNTVIEQTKQRQSIITNLKGRLTALETEQNALQQSIEDLRIIQQDRYLALADEEFAQIENVISQQQSFTDKLVGLADEVNALSNLDSSLRGEILSYRDEINQLVSQERDKILNRSYLQLDDANSGQKEKLFMASQEIVSQLSRGVPEFIAEKRRLMERANQLLILLRNQANAITSLAGDDPLALANAEAPIFVKTATDLRNLTDIESSRLWQDDRYIRPETTKITIPAGCGLARQLATDRKASFEISPFGLGQQDDLGCFTLWNSEFSPDGLGFKQNLMVIDMNLIVEFLSTECSAMGYQLVHRGNGYVFREASPNDPTLLPFMVNTQRRYIQPTYDTKFEGSKAERSEDYWDQNFQVNTFLTGEIPNYPNGGRPALVGMPLIGNYDLYLDKASEGCSYEGATFVLHINYSTTPRQPR